MALACDARGELRGGRFHRSKPRAHPGRRRVLNARPLVPEPSLDAAFVGFAGMTFGLLRSNSPRGQPFVEVTGMVTNTKSAFDQVSDSRCRPQLGRKTERLGILPQPTQNQAMLLSRQFGRSAGMRLRRQPRFALLKIGGYPPLDGAWVDAKHLGHMRLRMAFLNSLHGQPSPSFEFRRGTSCSHDRVYAWSRATDY